MYLTPMDCVQAFSVRRRQDSRIGLCYGWRLPEGLFRFAMGDFPRCYELLVMGIDDPTVHKQSRTLPRPSTVSILKGH